MTPQQRDAVVAEARTWLGTRFLHGARLKGEGVDCAQLLIAVFAAVGLIKDFDPEPYPRQWFLHRADERYLPHIKAHARPVEPPFEKGDILTFRFGRAVSHAGIYVGDGFVLHADGRLGIVTESQIAMEGLKRRFAGAFRLGA